MARGTPTYTYRLVPVYDPDPSTVQRSDGAFISTSDDEYQEWLAVPNTPLGIGEAFP